MMSKRWSWRRRGTLAGSAVVAAIASLSVGWAMPADAAFPGGNGVIAFGAQVGSGDVEIVTVAADGTRTMLTSPTDNWSDRGPAFDASGTRIAFARGDGKAERAEIWVMNADGTGAHQVTSDGTFDWKPSWSPDGAHLAYGMRVAGPHNSTRMVIATVAVGATPTNGTPLGPFSGDDPAWSPDGRFLAFGSGGRLYVQAVGSSFAPADLGAGNFPSWAPTGSTVAYTLIDKQTNTHVFRADVDGSGAAPRLMNIAQLTTGKGLASQPAFSPDGRSIVYELFSGSTGALFTIPSGPPPPGQYATPTRISDGSASDVNPDWQPVVNPAPACVAGACVQATEEG